MIACDCKAWLEAGVNKSVIYPIKPDGDSAFQVKVEITDISLNIFLLVYCDMETDGCGWTVFQRRQDRSVDFYHNWIDYEEGLVTLVENFD